MRRFYSYSVTVVLFVLLAACALLQPPTIIGTPSVNSKFAKIQLGMSKNQVEGIIGASKDCGFGLHREYSNYIGTHECPYKNEGTLFFDHPGNFLVRIVVDTNAGEYRKAVK